MTIEILQDKLRNFIAAAEKHRDKINSMMPPDVVDESYVHELEKLNEAEAIQYLKSVDDSKLIPADLILSKKLRESALIEVYLDWLNRPGSNARLIGTFIGRHLYGTRHREASHLLSRIVRDKQEDTMIRRLAYSSLEDINLEVATDMTIETLVDNLDRSEATAKERMSSLEDVNWEFVDSFLPAH